MNSCTISDNVASTQGGGILNRQPGRLTIQSSTVSGNLVSDGHGGGIYNLGEVTLCNCTISGNVANGEDVENDSGVGGGIYRVGLATIDSCTLAYNQATVAAGGLENRGTVALRNSIVSV